jgi:DNA-binding LytR/AlgR family response regulator
VAPDIEMTGTTDSARQTVEWLRSRPRPDFLLMDIHLADGSAFDIFRMTEVNLPVIFTTAYDKYALQAFEVMGIDYLLYNQAQVFDYNGLVNRIRESSQVYKSRLLGRIGNRSFFVDISDVAYFVADNKVVYLVAADGTRYIVEHTLETLESPAA